MLNGNRRWTAWVALLVVALFAGCPGGDEPDGNEPPGGPSGEQTAAVEPPVVEETSVEEPPPPPTMPDVLLTDDLRQTCVLVVGDPMPDGQLPDPAGKVQSLSGLSGENLTVLFFWTAGDTQLSTLAAQTAMEDLQKDVLEPYADQGLRVIGINEGDAPDVVGRVLAEAGATFPTLIDADGAFFSQVAKEKLPRPYLLDGTGKILWFDLEFSRTTRDNLLQAIDFSLGRGEAKPQ